MGTEAIDRLRARARIRFEQGQVQTGLNYFINSDVDSTEMLKRYGYVGVGV